ncbi:hypothetical protein ACTOJ1_000257 [Shigella flexneri]
MKKDFILMEAGSAGLMKTKIPNAFQHEEHFTNADRLTRRKGFGMGGIVLDILEPIKKAVDKILNETNYIQRDSHTSLVIQKFSEQLSNDYKMRQQPTLSNARKLSM